MTLFCCLSYNLYFFILLSEERYPYLLYLDVLVGCALLSYFGVEFLHFRKRNIDLENRLTDSETLIARQLSLKPQERRLIEHDLRILEERLQEQFTEKCDLQDYITKWCHELKIPLAGCLILVERMKGDGNRLILWEQLERMNQLMKNMLLGCRLQSRLFDLQIQRISLDECVKASLHNNQFFLVHRHFDLHLNVDDSTVYSDKTWLVYILDQLIGNAIKYCSGQNRLEIRSVREKGGVSLFVKDYGEGIKDDEIRRIFEKGFTGSSHHNGTYKSTGMGLYMVKKILEKLEHTIEVESVPGEYTLFTIHFQDQRVHFLAE